MHDKTDISCNCTIAEYIDEQYICRYTGNQCIYDKPVENICKHYYSYKTMMDNYIKREKRGKRHA